VTLERVFLYEFTAIPAGVAFPGRDVVRLATAEEAKALAREPALKFGRMTEARVDRLYADGHRCVRNLSGGKVAGYSWLGFGEIEIPRLGLAFQLRQHEGYIYKGFTHPDFRGRGAANDRYLCWLKYLAEHGKTAAVAYFSFDNLATLTRVRKLGLRKLGTATLLAVGPFQRVMLAGDLRRRRYRSLAL